MSSWSGRTGKEWGSPATRFPIHGSGEGDVMSPRQIEQDIGRFNAKLDRWRADLVGSLWGATVFASLLVFPLCDLVFRLPRSGRLVCWVGFLAVLATGLFKLYQEATRKRTPESIAVHIERNFPQLDNHLINYLQFS